MRIAVHPSLTYDRLTMKTASSRGTKKGREAEPFSKRKVDLTKFKPDIPFSKWKEIFNPARIDLPTIFFFPIETLTPTKTIGLGRTNLTMIMATIVQTDAATAFANFDRRATPSREPVIQMHFRPSAYGIMSTSTYIMSFVLETTGPVTFQAGGNFNLLSNPGAKTVSGKTTVSLVFKNVPPATDLFGFLQQTGGGAWTWFSTRVTFPPLLITA